MSSVIAQLGLGGLVGIIGGFFAWLFIGIPIAESVIAPLVASPEALDKSAIEIWFINFVGKTLALGYCAWVGALIGKRYIPL